MAAPLRWAFILARQGEAWASGSAASSNDRRHPGQWLLSQQGPVMLMCVSGCGGQNEVWCGGGKGGGAPWIMVSKLSAQIWAQVLQKTLGTSRLQALRWNIEESNFQVPSLSESISLYVQWVALLWRGLEMTLVNQYGTPRLCFCPGEGLQANKISKICSAQQCTHRQ